MRKRITFSYAVLFFAAFLIVFSEVWHPLLHHSRDSVCAEGFSESAQRISAESCDLLCPVCTGQLRFTETASPELSLPSAVSAEKSFFSETYLHSVPPREGRPRAPPVPF